MDARIQEMIDHHEINRIAGRYVDKFVREDWLIRDRLTIRDWSISHKLEADPLSEQGIVDGNIGPGDASYRALGHEYGGWRPPFLPSSNPSPASEQNGVGSR